MTLRGQLRQSAARLGLNDAAINTVVDGAGFLYGRRGETLAHADQEGHDVLFTVSGAVRLEVALHRPIVLEYVAPGRFLCLAQSRSTPMQLRVTAHEPCVVARIPYHLVTTILQSLAMRDCLRLVGNQWRGRFHLAAERSILAMCPLKMRIARAMTDLGRRFGLSHPDGVLIGLRLTHQEIGDLVGASRAQVTKSLQRLATAHVVVSTRDGYVLPARTPQET